jgi:tetratricopeptide (TPR) repeat protein
MKYAVPGFALVTLVAVSGRPIVHAAGQATAAQAAQAAQAAAGAVLAPLEQAVEASPDDLRAANDYRMAVIPLAQYDRALAFFDRLAKAHPQSANVHLNYGFAYVDKIPSAGSITQVILANNALGEFTKAVEIQPTWIGLYTRGNSYLYWPRIFGRTPLGVADLEAALKIQRAEPKKSYHVRVFVALGDAYWKMDDTTKASATWNEGLTQYPDSPDLKARVSKQGDDLQKLFDTVYDANRRVDTSLKDLWSEQ